MSEMLASGICFTPLHAVRYWLRPKVDHYSWHIKISPGVATTVICDYESPNFEVVGRIRPDQMSLNLRRLEIPMTLFEH